MFRIRKHVYVDWGCKMKLKVFILCGYTDRNSFVYEFFMKIIAVYITHMQHGSHVFQIEIVDVFNKTSNKTVVHHTKPLRALKLQYISSYFILIESYSIGSTDE